MIVVSSPFPMSQASSVLRRVILTGSIAAVTATGAWYGAGLKTQREHKQVRHLFPPSLCKLFHTLWLHSKPLTSLVYAHPVYLDSVTSFPNLPRAGNRNRSGGHPHGTYCAVGNREDGVSTSESCAGEED